MDGSGSPPSAQIIFSAIDKGKEGDCALPPEDGEGLQDTAAGRPGEPPPPLHKPLKIYPTISDLRQLPHLRLHLPGPKNSPVYIQSLPEHCLRLKKIKKKKFFKTKELLKNTQYTEPAHCRKTPQGGPHPSKNKNKKKRKIKKKVKKERK